MKTTKPLKKTAKRGSRRFRLKLPLYSTQYYLERALKLETTLAAKPRVVHIEMLGGGEIPADTALLMRSILLKHSPCTKIVTNARTSLQGASVLVWLLGDERKIRDDARIFFKRNPLADEELTEVYAGIGDVKPKYKDSYSDLDPEDADYARVLELINAYLPVDEYAGRVVGVPLLRDFGLIENERADNFLIAAFSKSQPALEYG